MTLRLKTFIPTVLVSVALSQAVSFAALHFWGDSYLSGVAQKAAELREKAEIEAFSKAQFEKYSKAADVVPNDARVYGDLKARFTLAEFSDMECPFCKRLHPNLKQIVDRSNGAVNWQWRHLPLSFHNPAATDEASAAECFADQKGNRGFWVFLDQVFEKSAGNGGGIKDLSDVVKWLGGDKTKFSECMSANKFKDRIADHMRMGEKIGATGTPMTVVIDNLTGEKEIVSGAQPISAFVTIMKKMAYSEKADAQAEEKKEKGESVDGGDVVSQKMLGYGSQGGDGAVGIKQTGEAAAQGHNSAVEQEGSTGKVDK